MLPKPLFAISVCPLLIAISACSGQAPTASNSDTNGTSAAPVALTVPAGEYKLDPTHAMLEWSISHMGVSNYHARFKTLDATLNLNPADIEKSTIKVMAKADSIDTGYPADYKKTHPNTGFDTWDAELGRSDKFLDGAKNPDITFVSTKVEKTGDATGKVTGDLTFRGITKPVTLDVNFIGQQARHFMLGVPVVGFEAEGEIVRLDFGMPRDALGPTAKIYFNGEFLGPKPSGAAPAKAN